jgi:hypothetical protein
MRKVTICAIAFVMLMPAILLSMPPSDMPPGIPEGNVRDWDYYTYFDANNILTFVNNRGNIGCDDRLLFGKIDGFYYPFTGDTMDIINGTEDRTVVYSAGLWLGGKVGNSIRVAIAEYSREYVPGPMEGGTYQPDCAEFRVYKIDKTSGPGDADYDEWPFDQGAPADPAMNPRLTGDQTLWTVFNDADPERHVNMLTQPLGIEVQQTVWGSDNTLEENAVYVKYKLYNQGGNYIDSFYITFWADPDLGNAGDDLVGCDTLDDIFFTYNDGADSEYGVEAPAWGGRIISGPVVPSPGDIADFDGNPLPDNRNLGMTAFTKYINGTDPTDYLDVFYRMKGLRNSGSPVIDPITGNPTMYYVSGDPVTGEGWVDEVSGDRRLMATMGPLTFSPGDSQQVVIKLAVGRSINHLSSITALRHNLMADWGKAVVDPAMMYRYYMYAFDPIIADVYIGNLADGYSASDIDQSTVLVNDSIVPTSFEVIGSHPDFSGEVLKMTMPVEGFIRGYGPLVDINVLDFWVSGEYDDEVSFLAPGSVTIIGKLYGDSNGDGLVDIDDVVFLLQFMFAGGPAPAELIFGDNNCSGEIDIDDVIYLIEYIFGGGASPREGCR